MSPVQTSEWRLAACAMYLDKARHSPIMPGIHCILHRVYKGEENKQYNNCSNCKGIVDNQPILTDNLDSAQTSSASKFVFDSLILGVGAGEEYTLGIYRSNSRILLAELCPYMSLLRLHICTIDQSMKQLRRNSPYTVNVQFERSYRQEL